MTESKSYHTKLQCTDNAKTTLGNNASVRALRHRKYRTSTYIFEELLSNNTSPGVDRQLHFTDLLVNFLHEMDDKVHQFMFVHLLCVEVGDEKTDVIALRNDVGSQRKER